jgi:phage shock protein PspC (stress-responsive transcriptional regulator)
MDSYGEDAAARSARRSQPVAPAGFLAPYGLVRPVSDRKVVGVCAAIGRATGTDPLLWRVILAVLVVFAGAGLVLYTVGWLLFGSEGDEVSPLESLFSSKTSSTSIVATGLLIVGGSALFFITMLNTSGRPFLVFAALAIAIAVLARRGGAGPDSPAAPADSAATRPGYRAAFAPHGPYSPDRTTVMPAEPADGLAATRSLPAAAETVVLHQPAAAEHGSAAPVYPYEDDGPQPNAPVTSVPYQSRPFDPGPPTAAPPQRPATRGGSRLGLVTGCFIVMALSVLSIVSMSGVAVPFSTYVAVPLILCALGLVVGTWWGRSPMLYVAGLGLSAVMVATMLIEGAGISGYGYHDLRPSSVDDVPQNLTVQFGSTDLDLTRLAIDDDTHLRLDADVWVGSLYILVGPDTDVDLVLSATQTGSAQLDGQHSTGAAGEQTLHSDGGEGGARLSISADVGLGTLEVLR